MLHSDIEINDQEKWNTVRHKLSTTEMSIMYIYIQNTVNYMTLYIKYLLYVALSVTTGRFFVSKVGNLDRNTVRVFLLLALRGRR